MNIQQENGIISTINFTPFFDTDEYKDLRKTLFDEATCASNIKPLSRTDIFDESILVFESVYKALSFLCHVFRTMATLQTPDNSGIILRSSLCCGDYFLHQDQIYGDAVNLATKLSYSSRENELLVCGIDSQVIEEFIKNHDDITCFTRDDNDKCVSICLLDNDPTSSKEDTRKFNFEFNKILLAYKLSRNRKLNIGRSSDSDIFIDSDQISRNHATITLNYDSIFIEDHSSNGTYLYFDDHEIFLTKDSIKLNNNGQISCGLSFYPNSSHSSNYISYHLCEETSPLV